MVEVKVLAEKILDFLLEQEEKRGQLNVPIATLYKTFQTEAPYDVVQQAVKFLTDRDFIVPFSYSLTAKGRQGRRPARKS